MRTSTLCNLLKGISQAFGNVDVKVCESDDFDVTISHTKEEGVK